MAILPPNPGFHYAQFGSDAAPLNTEVATVSSQGGRYGLLRIIYRRTPARIKY